MTHFIYRVVDVAEPMFVDKVGETAALGTRIPEVLGPLELRLSSTIA